MEEVANGFYISANKQSSVSKSDGTNPGRIEDKIVLIYFDNIIILGRSFGEHLSDKRGRSEYQKLKMPLFQKPAQFLGHIISKECVEVDLEKVDTIAKMKPPNSLKEIRAILGLVGFYRRFVADFV